MLGTGGTTQWNEYLIADGKMAGEHYTLISASLATTTKTRYFTGDHLGSIAVITDESAAIVERLSYDAWGKRRFANGADDPSGSITSQTTRGFTGHEMIDAVGLVNMNGRVQDPALGKFLSADPNIQDPGDSQSFNRYSYVQNRPLSATDPTGFKPNGQSAGFGDGLETIRSTLETERWIRSRGLTPCDYACQFAASGSGGVYSSGPLITSGGAIISGFTGNVIGSIFSDIGINLPGEVAGYGGPSGAGYGGYDAKAASSQTTGTTGGGARAAGGSHNNHIEGFTSLDGKQLYSVMLNGVLHLPLTLAEARALLYGRPGSDPLPAGFGSLSDAALISGAIGLTAVGLLIAPEAALLGAAIGVGTQLATGSSDWRSLTLSAAFGSLSGGFGARGASILAGVVGRTALRSFGSELGGIVGRAGTGAAAGGIAGGTADFTNQVTKNPLSIDLSRTAQAAAWGAGIGALAGGVGRAAQNRYVTGSVLHGADSIFSSVQPGATVGAIIGVGTEAALTIGQSSLQGN